MRRTGRLRDEGGGGEGEGSDTSAVGLEREKEVLRSSATNWESWEWVREAK